MGNNIHFSLLKIEKYNIILYTFSYKDLKLQKETLFKACSGKP